MTLLTTASVDSIGAVTAYPSVGSIVVVTAGPSIGSIVVVIAGPSVGSTGGAVIVGPFVDSLRRVFSLHIHNSRCLSTSPMLRCATPQIPLVRSLFAPQLIPLVRSLLTPASVGSTDAVIAYNYPSLCWFHWCWCCCNWPLYPSVGSIAWC